MTDNKVAPYILINEDTHFRVTKNDDNSDKTLIIEKDSEQKIYVRDKKESDAYLAGNKTTKDMVSVPNQGIIGIIKI